MKKIHVYDNFKNSMPGESYYFCITKSEYKKEDNVLRLEWQGDNPDKDDVKVFIKNEYPELSGKPIDRFYFDNEWICDWNIGKPEERAPFMFILVLFKNES